MIIITNNNMVDRLVTSCDKEFITGSYGDVLIRVRDLVHKGHKLLSHPLSGSVKPNQTPFKSIIIKKEAGQLEPESLQIIEDSIMTYEKFMKIPYEFKTVMDEQIADDFREVDYRLIAGALKSALNE